MATLQLLFFFKAQSGKSFSLVKKGNDPVGPSP